MKKRSLKSAIFILVVVCAGIFVYLNLQTITDVIAGIGYEPTAEMKTIKSNLALTGDAERIFNASRPSLDSKDDFNSHCDSHNSDVSVLGCYTNRQIYIYNAPDDTLKGVKESTTAHELLHAVWSRLDYTERAEVEKLLQEVYNDKQYHELLSTDLSNYDDSDRIDEMHSRIGTEIKKLPEKLEAHYAKYFSDQDKVVAYYESYIKPFNELKKEIETLSSELEKLKASIDTNKKEYEQRAEDLNLSVAEFNNCASTAGCFSSAAYFNARRAELVSEQASVEELYNNLDSMTNEYNEKVKKYNDNILKNQNLESIINSNSKIKEL